MAQRLTATQSNLPVLAGPRIETGPPVLPQRACKALARFFCHLSSLDRVPVLDYCERLYGRGDRGRLYEFAVGWPRQRIGLSNPIADRLMAVVPPFMPKEQRDGIVRDLWEANLEATRHRLRLPTDTPFEDASAKVRAYFRKHVQSRGLSQAHLERYPWLQLPSASARAALLDLMLEEERDTLLPHVLEQLEFALRTDRREYVHRVDQVYLVGASELEISIERRLKRPRLENRNRRRRRGER